MAVLVNKKQGTDTNGQFKKILIVMALAKSPVPIDYISQHSGIKDPLNILETLEETTLIRRTSSSNWSCCREPLFELNPKLREKSLEKVLNFHYE